MRNVQLVGVPFHFGQPHPGVKKAAKFLRNAGLCESMKEILPVIDHGDLSLPLRQFSSLEGSIKFSREAGEASRMISDKIESLDIENDFLLNIGGDHGMALGSIHGILSHHPDSIIVWADAHGDINTPLTSTSRNFHGMPLSFLLNVSSHGDFNWLKRFIKPHKLILIGPRDLDDGEKKIIEELSIQYYSSDDLNHLGGKEVIDMALHKADPYGQSPIHLSFDVDVFDTQDFHSTGTKVKCGPRLEEIFLAGGTLAETGRLKSMDMVEFNPDLGSASQSLAAGDLVTQFIIMILSQVKESTLENNFLTTRLRFSEITHSYRVG